MFNNFTNASSTKTNVNCYLGCRNNGGTAANHGNFTTNWVSFGQGLNQTESVALTNIITTFQTTLGRN